MKNYIIQNNKDHQIKYIIPMIKKWFQTCHKPILKSIKRDLSPACI